MLYRVALSMFPAVNISTAAHIIERMGSEEAFFTASENELGAMLQLSSKIRSREFRNKVLESARKELEFIDRHHIRLIYFRNDDYPKRLLECDDAPILLYTLGDTELDSPYVLSIVGTRHATPYGIEFTRDVVRYLSERLPQKPMIVSGLAYGIDIAAHREALACGCPTVAVLAHGLNTIYPATHRVEASRIVKEGGMLLTEYTSSATIHKGSFLERNRIVAGLADGVLVTESAERGGALVTARIAADYQRDVLALPGRISDNYSKGCNELIARNIAALVTCPADVANHLGWQIVNSEESQPSLPLALTPTEQAVIDYLTAHGEGTMQQLAIAAGVAVHDMMSKVIDMEFRQIIMSYPGGRYRLK